MEKEKTKKKNKKRKKVKGYADGIPVYCAHDKIVPIEKVRRKRNPKNSNTHSEGQIRLLAKIIKFHGWRGPITISLRSGLIVRGHGRLDSAELLGVSEVPIDYQNYKSDEEELADLEADNRIAELAEVDKAKRRENILDLKESDYDLELVGFDEGDLESFLAEYSDVDFKDLDDELEDLVGMEDVNIVIVVPEKHKEEVIEWLSNGESKTGPGMGKGVLKRCGLL